MEKHSLQLTVVSPERTLFDGIVEQVTLPGELAPFTVLPRHAAMISSLVKGTIQYVDCGQKCSIDIESGFVEIKDNVVDVCIEQ